MAVSQQPAKPSKELAIKSGVSVIDDVIHAIMQSPYLMHDKGCLCTVNSIQISLCWSRKGHLAQITNKDYDDLVAIACHRQSSYKVYIRFMFTLCQGKWAI